MLCSVTEQEYLRQSLANSTPVRLDSRRVGQFRPLETDVDILPMTNGSASVKTADGAECIVGVKAKVTASHNDLVEVSVEVPGQKDTDSLPQSLGVSLIQALYACPQLQNALYITPTYAFKLYVDCVILSYTSYPLGLVSAGVFQALKATRLPLKIESSEDTPVDEIPQFNDDWSLSVPLCDGWTPPVLFVVALVGPTALVDPTDAEETVAEAAICITWKDGHIAAPLRTIDIGTGSYSGPFDQRLVFTAYDLIEAAAPSIIEHFVE